MAIRANQRQVKMSEESIRRRFKEIFKGGDKIVGVNLQHSLDAAIPDLIIFLVEKPNE